MADRTDGDAAAAVDEDAPVDVADPPRGTYKADPNISWNLLRRDGGRLMPTRGWRWEEDVDAAVMASAPPSCGARRRACKPRMSIEYLILGLQLIATTETCRYLLCLAGSIIQLFMPHLPKMTSDLHG